MIVIPFVVIILSIALLVYWKQIYSSICERIRIVKLVDKIAGPVSIPILGTTWMLKWNITGLSIQLRDMGIYYSNKGHGLIRMWMATRPVVICIRPETAKLILERTDIITKGDEYNILIPWLGTGLLTSSGLH
ncbi:hypothetical protein DICVIV_03047 [Dictyocaulus viviparus]|uniref:Uncharacterized protein n=1 Tax=Dictyocaulus viviparus TaxID=29172 RepID=A0A0D8Y1T3_DICVI|nr:hypothetical protein DICVIV_03047 [Dictyocaulus viviparus]